MILSLATRGFCAGSPKIRKPCDGSNVGGSRELKGKILASSFSAALGLLLAPGAANAACAFTGVWHLSGMLGRTPDIKAVTTQVRNPTDDGAIDIKVFQNVAQPFSNDTARALQCKLNVSGGAFTGSCRTFGVNGFHFNTLVNGNISLGSACDMTGGTISINGDPTPVTIRGGHINGNSGAGIATQGSKQVLHFNLVKN